ncbi:hypothetical protein [Kitasatospora sp. NPDC085464]|uniref:hypothetical protein n=1 Tax=Kitasatospora sp. NPDC085464 TaxID=3364063 RepID=UPI0037C8E9A8
MNRIPIPLRCINQPRVGDRVVLWIALQPQREATFAGCPVPAQGRVLFGNVDRGRRDRAIRELLCQVCGQRLGGRAVLIVRPADVQHGYTAEPALHPECAAYAVRACPVLSGEKSHYRAHTAPVDRLEDEWAPAHDESARQGAPVEEYSSWLVETGQLRPAVSEDGELQGVKLGGIKPLRVRLVRHSTAFVEAAALLKTVFALFDGDGPESA